MSNKQKTNSAASYLKIFWVTQILLIVSSVAAAVHMAGASQTASTAADQLSDGQKLISRLNRLKQDASKRPADLPDARITELIEDSVATIGIRPQSIRLISPQPASRLAQGRYGRKNTLVLLRDVTMEQVAKLTHMLHVPKDTHTQPLDNTMLRFMTPDDNDQGDKWDVEIVFSQTVIMPQQKRTSSDSN